MKSTETYSDKISRLQLALQEADAVVIGAGAGIIHICRICLYRGTI